MVAPVVLDTTAFALTTSYDQVDGLINPGNQYLFPWLSGIASLYEKYRFVSLQFHLMSANPATHAGSVFMAVDVDPVDPVPSSSQEMLANANAVTSTVWQSVSLKVDIARANEGIPWRYTYTRNGGSGLEPRTTYIGQLFVASAGTSGTPSTFNLEVEYEIDLSVEQLMLTQQQVISGTCNFSAATDTLVPLSLNATPGRLAAVVSGSGRVPILDVAAANLGMGADLIAGVSAIDLGSIRTGSFVQEFTAARVGDTPVALMGDSFPNMAVFDSLGSYLGQSFAVDSGAAATRGVAGAGAVGTTGLPGRATTDLTIASILAFYRAARYLVPVLQSIHATPTSPSTYTLKYTS
jgi:hypothetical protein